MNNIKIISESKTLTNELHSYLENIKKEVSEVLNREFIYKDCEIHLYLNFDEFLSITELNIEDIKKVRYPYKKCNNKYYFYKNNDIVSILNDYFYHKTAFQILLDNFDIKCEWVKCGLAAFFSKNEHIDIDNYQEFKIWYLYMIRRRDRVITKDILTDTENNMFISLSFLVVCYILKVKKIDVIDCSNKLQEEQYKLLEEALEYYDAYFEVNKISSEFSPDMTTEQFLYFCWQNMLYGYVDKLGVIHNNLKEIHTNYNINTLECTIKERYATCIEHAALQKYFFDSLGVENLIFVYRLYDKENKEKFKMHCFTLYREDNKWCQIECTHMKMCGIHKFNSIDEAIEWVLSRYDDERELIQIPKIPEGLTFQEFNEYIDTFR